MHVEKQEAWMEQLSMPKHDDHIRYTFELDYEGRHIGGLSSYMVDEDFNWTKEGRRCVGIAICEPDYWGRGSGGKAFRASPFVRDADMHQVRGLTYDRIMYRKSAKAWHKLEGDGECRP